MAATDMIESIVRQLGLTNQSLSGNFLKTILKLERSKNGYISKEVGSSAI